MSAGPKRTRSKWRPDRHDHVPAADASNHRERGSAFAGNCAADDAVWRPYSEDDRIVVIGDDLYQVRIEDDPIVPLLHRLRTVESASPRGLLGLIRRLLPI